VATPLVWSLWASQGTGDAAARDVGRFARELKRLLLFGVMKPEAWPEMVAEVTGAPPARPRSGRKGS
jgi:hypothetical protein